MGSNRNQSKVKLCREDKIYYGVTWLIVTIFLISVLYPLIFVVSSSFSSGQAIATGRVLLLPVNVTLDGYKAVFRYNGLLRAYANTIFYTVAGTFVQVCMTLICAYPLSRKDLPGRGYFTFFFTLTMFVSGGMIPSYLLLKGLRLLNTPWAMIVPGAMSVHNMLIVRTFMQNSIPGELKEAAMLDGCSDTKLFFKVYLPLCKASIAVITLYYAVGHWNSYFSALLYLTEKKLMPLQIVLRQILVQNEMEATMLMDSKLAAAQENLRNQLKYALIIVASVPILCAYPFVQKHFVKGVMIGSIKG